MTTYEITDARILDGTGRAPFAGSVRVEGNRIVAVRPGSPPPDGGPATVIEGAGRTLMPGLVESHAHIGLADTASYDLARHAPPDAGLAQDVAASTAAAACHTARAGNEQAVAQPRGGRP